MESVDSRMEELRAFLGPGAQRTQLFVIGMLELLAAFLGGVFIIYTSLEILGGLIMVIAISGVYFIVRGFRYSHYQQEITRAIDRIADTAGMDMLLKDFMCSRPIDESIRLGTQYIYLSHNRLILSADEIQSAGVRYTSDAESSSTDLELKLRIEGKVPSIIVGIGPQTLHFRLSDKRYQEVAAAINEWLKKGSRD